MATNYPKGERPFKLTMSLTAHARINQVLKAEYGRKFTMHEMFLLADYCPELAQTLIDSMDMLEVATTTRDRLIQLQYHQAEAALKAYQMQQESSEEDEGIQA
jgi:hypothetical protein